MLRRTEKTQIDFRIDFFYKLDIFLNKKLICVQYNHLNKLDTQKVSRKCRGLGASKSETVQLCYLKKRTQNHILSKLQKNIGLCLLHSPKRKHFSSIEVVD